MDEATETRLPSFGTISYKNDRKRSRVDDDAGYEGDMVEIGSEDRSSTPPNPKAPRQNALYSVALAHLVHVFLHDAAIYTETLKRRGAERFHRYGTRALKRLGDGLKAEAARHGGEPQREAAHFVRRSARRAAILLIQVLRKDASGAARMRDVQGALSRAKAAQLDAWLGRSRKGRARTEDVGGGEEEKKEGSQLCALYEVQEFITSSLAYAKFRKDFWAWAKLD